ncbi:hypothetical protein ACPPVO_37655 [Dactylosporangium sp. McL0621]|uniref:hypothetical protein n=1 Tax=Dactylosporangium sp. McL0621 TaxID=3415678 RepID=UPI003CF425E4
MGIHRRLVLGAAVAGGVAWAAPAYAVGAGPELAYAAGAGPDELFRAGRFDDADRGYARVLRAKPGDPHALGQRHPLRYSP